MKPSGFASCTVRCASWHIVPLHTASAVLHNLSPGKHLRQTCIFMDHVDLMDKKCCFRKIICCVYQVRFIIPQCRLLPSHLKKRHFHGRCGQNIQCCGKRIKLSIRSIWSIWSIKSTVCTFDCREIMIFLWFLSVFYIFLQSSVTSCRGIILPADIKIRQIIDENKLLYNFFARNPLIDLEFSKIVLFYYTDNNYYI